jgi:hypothetical protein
MVVHVAFLLECPRHRHRASPIKPATTCSGYSGAANCIRTDSQNQTFAELGLSVAEPKAPYQKQFMQIHTNSCKIKLFHKISLSVTGTEEPQRSWSFNSYKIKHCRLSLLYGNGHELYHLNSGRFMQIKLEPVVMVYQRAWSLWDGLLPLAQIGVSENANLARRASWLLKLLHERMEWCQFAGCTSKITPTGFAKLPFQNGIVLGCRTARD